MLGQGGFVLGSLRSLIVIPCENRCTYKRSNIDKNVTSLVLSAPHQQIGKNRGDAREQE
jgi:hypothetical protein